MIRIKRFRMLVCFILLVGFWGLPTLTNSQNNIDVTRSEVDIQFGQKLKVHLVANSDIEIVSAEILMDADSSTETLSKVVAIEPATSELAFSTELPLINRRLRPFSTLTYHWILTDVNGNQHETMPETAIYQDNRLNWQSVLRTRDNVTVYYADGNDELAKLALAVVDEVKGELLAIMPASFPPNLQIYLYPTVSDLRATMQLAGYEWVAGQAIPEFEAIAIALPEQTTAAVELRRTLPHELSHLLLYQTTQSNYEDAPIWFDEGLATFFEPEVNPTQAELLQNAINAGTNIPIEQLCLHFPNDEQSALLAYAQGGSLITFIQQRYGNQALTQMVNIVADGAGCEAMVRRVLGISSLELEQEWLNSLRDRTFWQSFLGDNSLLWLFALGGLGLIGLLWLNPIKTE